MPPLRSAQRHPQRWGDLASIAEDGTLHVGRPHEADPARLDDLAYVYQKGRTD